MLRGVYELCNCREHDVKDRHAHSLFGSFTCSLRCVHQKIEMLSLFCFHNSSVIMKWAPTSLPQLIAAELALLRASITNSAFRSSRIPLIRYSARSTQSNNNWRGSYQPVPRPPLPRAHPPPSAATSSTQWKHTANTLLAPSMHLPTHRYYLLMQRKRAWS